MGSHLLVTQGLACLHGMVENPGSDQSREEACVLAQGCGLHRKAFLEEAASSR